MIVTSVVDMRNFAGLLAEEPTIVDAPGAPPLQVTQSACWRGAESGRPTHPATTWKHYCA